MPTATLKFNLPDESDAFIYTSKSQNMKKALQDIYNRMIRPGMSKTRTKYLDEEVNAAASSLEGQALIDEFLVMYDHIIAEHDLTNIIDI